MTELIIQYENWILGFIVLFFLLSLVYIFVYSIESKYLSLMKRQIDIDGKLTSSTMDVPMIGSMDWLYCFTSIPSESKIKYYRYKTFYRKVKSVKRLRKIGMYFFLPTIILIFSFLKYQY